MEIPENNHHQNTPLGGPVSRKLSSVMLSLCSGDEVATKSTDFRKREALNTFASPIHQDNQLREPYELRSLSKKQVRDSSPATQQPHIPIEQGSEKKTYTLLSRDDVDWDEDLRPSDDNEPGGAPKETAIPMPISFAGGTSVPQKSRNATLKTKKPAKLPRAPGKTGSTARTHKKTMRLSSQSLTRADENLGDNPDCVDIHPKKLPEEISEGRENNSAQGRRAIDFCGEFTTRDQNATSETENDGLEPTDTNHTKQRRAVYGVGPGIQSEDQSNEGTELLSTDRNGQQGRGKEVGKKLAAALGNAEPQIQSTNLDCKPTNRDSSKESSSNNQGAAKPVVMPSMISPFGSKIGSTEQKNHFHTTTSVTKSQGEDTLRPHVGVPAEQHSGPDRDFYDGKQQVTTDQLNRSGRWIDSSSNSPQTGTENSAYPTLPLDNDQKRSRPSLEYSRPTPRILFIDKNGSPLVFHRSRKADRTPLRGGSSGKEEIKQTFFSYRPKRSESGYEGGSEEDTLDEGSSSPVLATFPLRSDKNFPPCGSERVWVELSNKLDGPSSQRSARANANASFERSVGEANQNITECDAHESTQKILLASTQHLAFQLEDERRSIDKVLETYNQQCHLVLDQLFKAQEERVELCERQMASIQTHQANLRQELIDRLQAGGTQMMTRKRARSEILPRGQDPGPLGQPEKDKKKAP